MFELMLYIYRKDKQLFNFNEAHFAGDVIRYFGTDALRINIGSTRKSLILRLLPIRLVLSDATDIIIKL